MQFFSTPVVRDWTIGKEYKNEIRGDIRTAQKNAWNALNDTEKADLEFYTILTLSGNSNDYISGLLQYVAFAEYEAMYKYVNGLYIKARDLCDQWWNPRGWFYYEMRDVNRTVTDRLRPQMNLTKKYFEEWQKGLSENILRIFSSEEEYLASCAHLAALQKEDRRNTPVKWNEVESAVISSGIVDKNELADLKIDFDKMIMETGQTFFKVSECLSGLVQWARDANDKNKLALENQWTGDSVVQKNNERELFVTINSFIENGADIDALNNAVENAFGEEAASWKTHLVNVKTALLNDFSALENYPVELPPEYYALGDEYTALIDRVVLTDFDMELAARETEWEIQRKDINDKYRNWRQNIDLILEKGRLDWKTGHDKMVNSYRAWREEFSDEYQNINNSWNEAYAAGLIDKEDWLAKVKKAADKASVETLLSLTGLEAERLTRIMDTRMPAGMITGYPTDEIENTLFDLLNAQGIRNLDNAAYLLDGMKSVTQPVIRQGMHGGTWDAGMIKAAAFDLARETNLQLAARESRKLAMTLSSVAEESIRNLCENIKSANDSFKKSMDNVFIIQGQWSKSGNNYIKNILVASTFTQPVVTEQKTVAGYRDYYMEPVTLKTNVDEGFLANLDSFATRALIDSIYSEVNALTTTIFGIGEESRKINAPLVKGKTLDDRFESPGLFGKHIGYEPLQKKLTGQEESKSEIFYDQGSGELGRLMSDFVFWAVIDGQGIAELSMAPWDKPLWDSRNSSFEAPSLRQSIDVVAQVGLGIISAVMAVPSGGASTVGFMALMAAVNVSDDLVFAGLDVAYGYKTIDEAGFEFGKAALISTVSTFGSGVFNGVAQAAGNGFFATGGLTGLATRNISNAFGKVAVQTAMGAVQAGVTGVISSAINGITYDSVNRFGYSLETFQAGLKSAGVSALVSTTSVFTSGMLKIANSGLNYEKLEGFSKVNKNNIERLNNFVGAIGGQGVQYALTGDFTLNILNTGLIPGSKANTGLLELHFGSGDPRLKVGTGGANVSPDNIAEVVSGARVWNINNRITGYTANSDFKEKNTLRALYGFGDKKQQNQLYNILDRKDNIIVETEKEYAAKTEIVDGQRVIRLGNYQAGMSAEDQMRLAVILGHEAYRDGYSPGKLNNNTDLSAIDSNSDEIMKVSVARIMMADRVNQDYQWFYDKNRDFAIESTVYELAVETGDMSLFENYLDLMYKNEEDYFWQWASTGGDFQNKYESFQDIPLFNGPSLDRVKEINEQKFEEAFLKYKAQLAIDEKYEGDLKDFVSKEGTDEELKDKLRDNKTKLIQFGYKPISYESLYLYGCMFMSTKYGLEAVLGHKVDMMWMHEFIKEHNLVIKESDLSKELMATIMDKLAGDQYTIKLVETGMLDANRLHELGNSENKYMAHLRIKNGEYLHSVMVSGIDYDFDEEGKITGIKAIHVANPWLGNTHSGKQVYRYEDIARFDIFEITQNYEIIYNFDYTLKQPIEQRYDRIIRIVNGEIIRG